MDGVSTCVVPPTLSSYGDWTFAAAGPRLWNSLPIELQNPDITYGLFRRQLKGNLFREAWTRRSVTSDMRRQRKTRTYLLTYIVNLRPSINRPTNRTLPLQYTRVVHTFLHWPLTLTIGFTSTKLWLWPRTSKKINVKGQLVQKIEWKQLDVRTRPITLSSPLTSHRRNRTKLCAQFCRYDVNGLLVMVCYRLAVVLFQ